MQAAALCGSQTPFKKKAFLNLCVWLPGTRRPVRDRTTRTDVSMLRDTHGSDLISAVQSESSLYTCPTGCLLVLRSKRTSVDWREAASWLELRPTTSSFYLLVIWERERLVGPDPDPALICFMCPSSGIRDAGRFSHKWWEMSIFSDWLIMKLKQII